jgi:hypothetical protein
MNYSSCYFTRPPGQLKTLNYREVFEIKNAGNNLKKNFAQVVFISVEQKKICRIARE